MIISHKHKFIFMRPRKVAGTTIQNTLQEVCGEHDIITSGYDDGNRNIDKSCWEGHPHPHLWDVKRLVGDGIWNEYFKFTFVRNPFDITLSRFFWNINGKGQKGFETTMDGFHKWFELYSSNSKFHDANLYSVNHQYPFLIDELCVDQYGFPTLGDGVLNSPIDLDFVGRYENLHQDLEYLCERLGIDNLDFNKNKNSKTKSKKKKTKYQEWFTDEMKEVMFGLFEKDLDLLGYDFTQDFTITKKSILIDREIFKNEDKNIYGASLIKVPKWVENPLGKYYLYFASHTGKYIRLAYSDNLDKPFQIFDGEVLRLDDTTCKTHIASPDVHIDEENNEIKMYYHGDTDNFQETFLGKSSDGLKFEGGSEPLGLFYFRVFRFGDKFFSVAKNRNKNSIIYESDDWEGEFKPVFEFLPNSRHSATYVKGDKLYLFYTTIGEAPESIYYCRIKIDENVENWEVQSINKLTKPNFEFEGAGSQLFPSQLGSATLKFGVNKLNELRDPCIFIEDDKVNLLYTFNGEGGIALGSLNSCE